MADSKRTALDAQIIARASNTFGGNTGGFLDTWFGPGKPLPPIAPPEVSPRRFDFPFGHNLAIQPRGAENVSFAQLKALSEYYLVRLAIETRKDQMAKLDWEFRVMAQPGEPKSKTRERSQADPRIRELTNFFRTPDGQHDWDQWLRILLEEVMVFDAPAILRRLTEAGQRGVRQLNGKKLPAIHSLEIIDGSTLKILIDDKGRRPIESAAYQQFLKGLPAIDLAFPGADIDDPRTGRKMDELMYYPRNPRSWKLYGLSPVEEIVTTINLGLRREMSQIFYYTEGNIPLGFVKCPEKWTPDQIRQHQIFFDSVLAGNQVERSKLVWIPQVDPIFPTKDVLKDEFDEWLARVVCFAFSISNSAFIKMVNRATSETQMEQATEEGLLPYMDWVVNLMNRLVRIWWKYDDIEFVWHAVKEEDALKQAQIDQIYVITGVLDVNEVRKSLGRDPMPEEPEAKPVTTPVETPAEQPASESQQSATKLAKRKKKLSRTNYRILTTIKTRTRTPERNKQEPKLRLALRSFLRRTGKQIAMKAEKLYGRAVNGLGKLTREQEARVRAILDELGLDDWDDLVDAVMSKLQIVAGKTAASALGDLGIDDKVIFATVNEAARDWARDRAAQLVGKRWVGDKLVDNPDTRWVISETTRDNLNRVITKAFDEGWTPAQLRDNIVDMTDFSTARADIIARTEMSNAQIQGTVIGWRESGVVEGKIWHLSADHDTVDDCDLNDNEVVGLDENFPSGDSEPPLHPGCWCSISSVVTTAEGEEIEGEELG